jgi:hypothetical protein
MNGQLERSSSVQVIAEALSVIDAALLQMSHRDVLSAGEVADVLLDVRTALTAATAEPV